MYIMGSCPIPNWNVFKVRAMRDSDISATLQQQVQDAFQRGTPLDICGGGSKAFLGNAKAGTPVDVSPHRGIVEYDPRELVLTARSGTPLQEIETVLSEAGQMLAFEPPHFGPLENWTPPWAVPLHAEYPARAAPIKARHAISYWAAKC
jgi:hypothetical protein